jgi:hypothetical protein
MIVLRKTGRPDYSVPKAYRPIMLLDTMAKLLSSCIADDLMYIAEQHGLLPATCFSRQPGRSTVDSLHILMKFITDTWALKDNHISLLFPDVKAAFLSIVMNRLLHILKRKGIPTQYVEWYRRRLENRTTHLFFNDYQSKLFKVSDGLDQECPLSPLAFIFYNLGFLDDVALAARAKSYEESNEKLRHMMEKGEEH